MSVESNSALMKMMSKLGLSKLSWSLRRLHCPVSNEALVLEVGSGGNPYPRSNVLVDAYEETRERHWDPLVHDRPTILANGERLPFKDKAFDFVIAAHVLEHSPNPEQFLSELQRVARAGYIETPDAFMERINPYKDHRLEATLRDGAMLIRKKTSWVMDPELVDLYEFRAKLPITRKLMPRYADEFHMRYYWEDKIEYKIVNPSADSTWAPVEVSSPPVLSPLRRLKFNARQIFLATLRWLFSQRSRNRSLDVIPLMQCSSCGEGLFTDIGDEIACDKCASKHTYRDGVLIMNSDV